MPQYFLRDGRNRNDLLMNPTPIRNFYLVSKYDPKPRTILFSDFKRAVRIVLILTKKRVWYVPTENSMKL